jgi:hypothetical protein
MKKKEILIIFVLAVLLTGLSLFFRYPFNRVIKLGWPFEYLEKYSICMHKDLLFSNMNQTCSTNYSIIWEKLIFDFLFWFMLAFVVYQLLKRIKGKHGKRK